VNSIKTPEEISNEQTEATIYLNANLVKGIDDNNFIMVLLVQIERVNPIVVKTK